MKAPLFSPEGARLTSRGPVWREHPEYTRPEPDPETEELMDWLETLPEAWENPDAR